MVLARPTLCGIMSPSEERISHPMKKLSLHKKSPVKILLTVFIIIVLLGILSGGLLYYKYYEPGKRSADLQRLAQESYEGVFLSMYVPDAFPEDIYPAYMGYDVVGCSHKIASFSDLSDYLAAAFSSGSEVTHVFLVLDPMALWNSCLHRNNLFYNALDEKLLAYVDTHPETTFTILYSAPSLEYWQSHASGDLDTFSNVVQVLSAPLAARENCSLHFASGQEWLIANPTAYDTPLELNAEAARYTMLLVLGGDLKLQNTEKVNSVEQFRNLITEKTASPAVYSDLSDAHIIYFGDSVFGNYHDFTSIPGVISALTGARSDNRGIGGSSATQLNSDDNSFPSVVQRFLAEENITSMDAQKLCFVINYGLNDYFSGYSTEDYRKGLEDGVRALQAAYPEAKILIVSSNFISSFHNGTEKKNPQREILSDFVAAAEESAADLQVDFLNVNNSLQWDASNVNNYMADAVHPNEQGRFLFGAAVIRALEEILL